VPSSIRATPWVHRLLAAESKISLPSFSMQRPGQIASSAGRIRTLPSLYHNQRHGHACRLNGSLERLLSPKTPWCKTRSGGIPRYRLFHRLQLTARSIRWIRIGIPSPYTGRDLQGGFSDRPYPEIRTPISVFPKTWRSFWELCCVRALVCRRAQNRVFITLPYPGRSAEEFR